ncbi:hypothetical protein HMPREF0083_04953 [Aneurinibacillus aneurinilyticus ATCC 12856]|uniref:Uncharacterized protein n=1 Tax=Aneurinibacillus aneurinilyticus ATCC 12856 TaxID=649747 RepID=U1Y464_ANEAE|nr:hypothetical protein HMPREF0083_04953 [Aneurinibacillus aneurinilyticus ATCC 12856]
MAGRGRFGKKKRVGAPCVPAEERTACLFPTAPAHRPLLFLSPITKICRFIESGVYRYNGSPTNLPATTLQIILSRHVS